MSPCMVEINMSHQLCLSGVCQHLGRGCDAGQLQAASDKGQVPGLTLTPSPTTEVPSMTVLPAVYSFAACPHMGICTQPPGMYVQEPSS